MQCSLSSLLSWFIMQTLRECGKQVPMQIFSREVIPGQFTGPIITP